MEKLNNIKQKENINKFEGLNTLDQKIEDIVKSIELEIRKLINEVLNGNIDIISSTQTMQKIAENSMIKVAKIFSKFLNTPIEELPFTLFFFGSPARNLMLPNSDLDIGIVFTRECDENLKKYLEEKIKLFPFDKIDVADWKTVNEMKEENCNSMIEYNKSVDAKYITGSISIANEHRCEVKEKDSRKAKIKRFITEFGIFHLYDYKNKKTDYGENLKYDYGGSRDIIFLDWYYGINKELCDDNDNNINTPFFKKGLNILGKEGIISTKENEGFQKAIEIILLVKFTLLSKFRETGDESLLYSSANSLKECYNHGEKAFKKIGVKNSDELFEIYFSVKIKLSNLVQRLKDLMLNEDPETAKIWWLAENEKLCVLEIDELLVDNDWQNIVPFAIHSKSNKVLFRIVDRIKSLNGYEYLLRIISQNDYIEEDTKELLLNSKLPEKYKEKLRSK